MSEPSTASAADRAAPPLNKLIGARNAVFVVFGVNGFVMATWLSRTPALRDTLALSPLGMSRLILAGAIGSLIALPLSGGIAQRFGTRFTVLAGIASVAVGQIGLATAPSALYVSLALVFYGAGSASWDVAMNVQGAAVERLLDRSIMPIYHGVFSLGTVAGAGVGALAARFEVPFRTHLLAVAAVGLVAAAAATVWGFLPDAAGARVPDLTSAQQGGGSLPGPAEGPPPSRTRSSMHEVLAAWRDPRTLQIGIVMFAMCFAEGSANDWLTLAAVDGYGVSHAVGALALGVFVSAMTLSRLAGGAVINRWGRTTVLRASSVLVAAGVLGVVGGTWVIDQTGFGIAAALGGLGAIAWGFGAALGFPIGISSASDDTAGAPARVGVVSTIGYLAFLSGPALLGALADRVGIARALLAVMVGVLIVLPVSGATRPRATT